ncbi:hypothetical protein BLOT_003486 [Blomia tropicalis]|nr:hypothetical protein BLOT_003486 [Blomia tropicalis]
MPKRRGMKAMETKVTLYVVGKSLGRLRLRATIAIPLEPIDITDNQSVYVNDDGSMDYVTLNELERLLKLTSMDAMID